jgi:hypothetical protein
LTHEKHEKSFEVEEEVEEEEEEELGFLIKIDDFFK